MMTSIEKMLENEELLVDVAPDSIGVGCVDWTVGLDEKAGKMGGDTAVLGLLLVGLV